MHLTAPIFHPLEKSFNSFSDRSSLSFVPKSDYCILKISGLTMKLIFFYEFKHVLIKMFKPKGLETGMLTDIWRVLSHQIDMLTHICEGFLTD